MARRILNRKELRNDFDAAERRKDEDEEVEDAADDTDEEDEEASGEEEEGAEDEEAEAEAEVEVEVKPKKKKAAPKVKAKAKPRSRAVKVTRLRVVWGVFNNSNQCVATYEYPKRKDADAHAAKLTLDKKNTHFVQPVKEPMEQKKEE
jgi:cobalamin biosynthesis protein CobT